MTPACRSISWKCGACFLCVLWFVGVGFAGATSTLPKTFNVPANTADKSLKQFSEQAGLEVVFSTRVTREVVTKPVKGDMTGRQALDAMLAGTGLIVIQDAKTGAFTVSLDPQGQKAPTTANVRPDDAKKDRSDPNSESAAKKKR
jgi:hypothetical protein